MSITLDVTSINSKSLSPTFILENNKSNKMTVNDGQLTNGTIQTTKLIEDACNDLTSPVPNDELDVLIKMERANK
jgi:hypothetical protein